MLRRQSTTIRRLRIQPLHLLRPPFAPRFKRYQAFGADLDQDALAEARAWSRSESELSRLPKGNTTYARSSGPGGQHVNKCATSKSSPRRIPSCSQTQGPKRRPQRRIRLESCSRHFPSCCTVASESRNTTQQRATPLPFTLRIPGQEMQMPRKMGENWRRRYSAFTTK